MEFRMPLQALPQVNQRTQLSKNYAPFLDEGLDAARKIKFPTNFLGSLVKDDLPEGSSISLFGPPGVGKTIFCENLANDFLRDGVNCLYVTLDKSPDDIRNDFKQLRIDISKEENEKRIVFVDGFNWLIGESHEGYHIENLGNLTELSIQIASAACDFAGPIFLVFDSVSPLSVYNPEKVVIKFLQILLARIKGWKGLGAFVVQEGVHSEEFCNTLGYLVDGIFDMKTTEEKGKIMRYFRIRSLKSMAHETKWMPFAIQANRNFKLKQRKGE